MAKPKETPHLRVRVEPQLLAQLEKSRAQTGRTLSGEIVWRLRESFQKDLMRDVAKEAAQEAAQEAARAVTYDRRVDIFQELERQRKEQEAFREELNRLRQAQSAEPRKDKSR
jgi:hypothetical protein